MSAIDERIQAATGKRYEVVTPQGTATIDGAHVGTRRNITISHGAIPTRPGERMSIGDVELEVVRIAAPCKLLDDVIGDGARHALRRRAGTVFRIISGGTIATGDEVGLPDDE